MYCSECGEKLSPEMRYCPFCGAHVDEQAREVSGEGARMRRCVECGERLSSFMAYCPACGAEVPGSVPTSIQEFAEQLRRTEDASGRATIIRSYPIPNTREDILEYMILATTNVAGSEEMESAAWWAKIEQCYQKAHLSFQGEKDFEAIQALYDDANENVKKQMTRGGVKMFADLMAHPLACITVSLLLLYAVIRLARGEFAGIDIIFDVLILWIVFRVVSKKSSNAK